MDFRETDHVLRKSMLRSQPETERSERSLSGRKTLGSGSLPLCTLPKPSLTPDLSETFTAGGSRVQYPHTWSKAASGVTASFPGCGIFL